MKYGKLDNEIANKLRAKKQMELFNKWKKPVVNQKNFGTTGTYKPICNCNVLPWEDCEHTTLILDHD